MRHYLSSITVFAFLGCFCVAASSAQAQPAPAMPPVPPSAQAQSASAMPAVPSSAQAAGKMPSAPPAVPSAVPGGASAPPPAAGQAAQPAAAGATAAVADDPKAPFKESLLFTPEEVKQIKDAQSGKVKTVLQAKRPQHSVIRLSGVFYRSPEDWIVWLNGQKVTPGAKTVPEIRGIVVEKTSQVHLKWYDPGYDNVISITMHPHQTYDVGTGIMLPGTR